MSKVDEKIDAEFFTIIEHAHGDACESRHLSGTPECSGTAVAQVHLACQPTGPRKICANMTAYVTRAIASPGWCELCHARTAQCWRLMPL